MHHTKAQIIKQNKSRFLYDCHHYKTLQSLNHVAFEGETIFFKYSGSSVVKHLVTQRFLSKFLVISQIMMSVSR